MYLQVLYRAAGAAFMKSYTVPKIQEVDGTLLVKLAKLSNIYVAFNWHNEYPSRIMTIHEGTSIALVQICKSVTLAQFAISTPLKHQHLGST